MYNVYTGCDEKIIAVIGGPFSRLDGYQREQACSMVHYTLLQARVTDVHLARFSAFTFVLLGLGQKPRSPSRPSFSVACQP